MSLPTILRGLFVVLAIAAVPALAAVITDRYTFEVPRENSNRLEGTFSLALGNITVGEARRGRLFEADVEIDDRRLTPAFDLTRSNRTARMNLGFSEGGSGVSWRGFRSRNRNTWELRFDRRTPLDLRFDLGLSEANLDFTGFRVERLGIRAGMATGQLVFDRRNAIELEHFEIEAGAARFAASGLGNARFRQLTFRGGAGSFDLDFSGARLPDGARADIDLGVSRLRIGLPENRPIVLHVPDSRLTRVSVPDEYVNQGGGVWHSPRVRNPSDALHVRIRAGIGSVTCETVPAR